MSLVKLYLTKVLNSLQYHNLNIHNLIRNQIFYYYILENIV
jgi:hypothetical protein